MRIKKPADAITYLGLQTGSNFNQKTHVKLIISKPSSAHFAIKIFTSLMKTQNVRLLYFIHFHYVIWNYFPYKFNRHQNSILNLKENDYNNSNYYNESLLQ